MIPGSVSLALEKCRHGTITAARMAVGDVRGALQYVPMFRGRTFVVVLDEGLPEFAVAEALLDLKALQEVGVNLVIAVAGNEREASAVVDRAMDMEIKFALVEAPDGVESVLERGQAAMMSCRVGALLGEEMSSLGVRLGAAKLIGLVNGPGVLRNGAPLHAVSCSAAADLEKGSGGEVRSRGSDSLRRPPRPAGQAHHRGTPSIPEQESRPRPPRMTPGPPVDYDPEDPPRR